MRATALMFAAEEGHIDIMKLLLEQGADANAAHTEGLMKGRTALMAAASNGHIGIVKLLCC